jgi:ElaA protein
VLRVASFDDLDPATLYAILKLRSEVFVVEQACVYLDPDGRDAERGARHLWFEEGGAVVCALRLLDDGEDVHRIGRVVTAPFARGRGLASRLTEHAVDLAGGTVVLDAQSYLVAWYTTLGFAADGPEFLDDGIPPTPMRREV